MKRLMIIATAVMLLAPVYFMVTGSLQDISGVFAMPPQLIPRLVTAANYEWLLHLPIAKWAINTLIVTVAGMSLSAFISICAGYGFCFFRGS